MNTNSKTLLGKVALVTGGSRGIGAAIAKRLAADGAAVALTYSASPGKADEVVRSIEAAGGKALAIKADAADTEAVRLAVAKTIGTFGGIDILVNNAGTGIFAPIEQFSLENFEKLIAINVRGLFVATQEAARHLRDTVIQTRSRALSPTLQVPKRAISQAPACSPMEVSEALCLAVLPALVDRFETVTVGIENVRSVITGI